jgi:AcrR family transcriptional regulator
VSNNRPEVRPVGTHFEGDLRAVLLARAVEALADVGVDRLSLRDVARRAGVSHAAPAHHFGDKAGLLTEIATEGFRRFADHLYRAAQVRTDDPLIRLEALGRAYVRFAEQSPGHFEVMFRPALFHREDPEYQQASARAYGELRSQVEACQAARWRAEVDTDSLTAAVWSLVHGTVELRSHGALERHLPDLGVGGVDVAMAIAASLILPSAGPVRRACPSR